MAVVGEPGQKSKSVVVLPEGVTAHEAQSLLELFSRVKARRFGRLTVMVSDGRVVDVEVLEKIDRNLVKTFST